MKKQTNRTQNQQAHRVYMVLTTIAAFALLSIGVLGWWTYSFTTNMVRTELSAQKIYFPEKGSPGLDPKEFPDLQQYAGQLVDTGPEARAYANGFIGRHLQKVAGGKVYSEVSNELKKDPTNQKLQQQKQTLFQGETLRGMLLGNGYAFWTIGKIAQIAAYVAFVASGLMVLLMIRLHLSRR